MDEHVPRAVTLGLRRRGIDVLTAQDDGRIGASDSELLARATELGRALFTQDDDLLVEVHELRRTAVSFAGLVYGHQTKLTIGQVIEDLELIAKVTEPDELMNAVVFLPL